MTKPIHACTQIVIYVIDITSSDESPLDTSIPYESFTRKCLPQYSREIVPHFWQIARTSADLGCGREEHKGNTYSSLIWKRDLAHCGPMNGAQWYGKIETRFVEWSYTVTSTSQRFGLSAIPLSWQTKLAMKIIITLWISRSMWRLFHLS